MGRSIHMVLQKKNEDNCWETVLSDLNPGRDHEFYAFLTGDSWREDKGVATEGLPEGFSMSTLEFMHGNTFMGSYGHSHVSLDRFVGEKLDEIDPMRKYTVEKTPTGMIIDFVEEDEYDPMAGVRAMQYALGFLFQCELEDYRLVFGYN